MYPSDLLGIAPGGDGNIWFADANPSRIGRVTRDGSVAFVSSGDYGSRADLAADARGNVWFTYGSSDQQGTLLAEDPRGSDPPRPIHKKVSALRAIVALPNRTLSSRRCSEAPSASSAFPRSDRCLCATVGALERQPREFEEAFEREGHGDDDAGASALWRVELEFGAVVPMQLDMANEEPMPMMRISTTVPLAPTFAKMSSLPLASSRPASSRL